MQGILIAKMSGQNERHVLSVIVCLSPICNIVQVQHRWQGGFKMDATDGVEDFRKQNMYWHLFDWTDSLGANFENSLKVPGKIIP